MQLHSILLGLVVVALAGCSSHAGGAGRQPEVVHLFAAASTKEAVEEIARDFQRETNIPVEISLGPSSGLAKQIDQGAAADLFLSADQASVNYLAAKDLVMERRDLLANQLVVIVPADSAIQVKDLHDLADPRIRRLALAEPKVPAGEYARQALRKVGVWDQVANRVVGGIDVRATLPFVLRGEVEAGLVYSTDEIGRPGIRVALVVDASLHDPILYPLVLLRRVPVQESARQFYDYLSSENAAAIFRRAGFRSAVKNHE